MQFCRAFLTAIILILCLSVLVQPQATQAQVTTDSDVASEVIRKRKSSSTPQRRLPQIKQLANNVSRLMKGESLAANANDKLDYALKLIASLNQVRRDPRLQRNAYLKRTEQQLVSRLKTIQNRTRVEHRRRKRRASAKDDSQQQQPAKIEIRQAVLAQLNAAAGVNNVGANRQNANANGNGNQVDYGPLLVDLIQRTISPNSWDVNGGLSSVQYFRPRHVLVVRAPGDVHDELGPILHQLRKE